MSLLRSLARNSARARRLGGQGIADFLEHRRSSVMSRLGDRRDGVDADIEALELDRGPSA
jgi:hypothetical protein